MTRELYIDNQRVDLPADARFQLTFQIADFGELRPRGSGSNTIRLPKTPRNTAIFDNCNFVQVASDFPYVLHSAYYYEDGWLVFNDATVYMLAITDTDFEIQCTWGNAPEISRLKSLDMGNVNGLGNVNYGAEAYAGVETGIRERQGEWKRYDLSVSGRRLYSRYTRGVMSVGKALATVGIGADGMSDAIKAYIDGLYVFPAVKTATRPYKDVSFAYRRRTTELDPTAYPYIGENEGYIFAWNQAVGENRRNNFIFEPVANGYTSIYSTSLGKRTPVMQQGKWYDVSVDVIVYNAWVGRSDEYRDLDLSKFRIAVVFGQVMGQQDNAAWRDNARVVRLPASNNSTLVLSHAFPTNGRAIMISEKKRIYINSNSVKLNGAGEEGVPPCYLAIYPYTTDADYSILYLYGRVDAEATVTVSAVGGEIEGDIQMPEETEDRQDQPTIGFSDVLRGTSAYDFATQALVNAGALFDHRDGKTRVYTYDDIANNGAQMLDWSDKLVYIKEENTFNQSGGAKNWVKYKDGGEYNGFGDGYYTDPLAQKLLKPDKTIIENRVFGFVNDDGESSGTVLQYMNAASLPMFKQKDNGEIETIESGMHLVRLKTPTGNSGIMPYLANSAGLEVGGNKPILDSSDEQPTFDNIKETNWERYIAMQQQYRKAKAVFMLNGQDIAELDFKRPIYLRQYAQAYVLTKVNYQPAATTVEMLLVR